MKINKIIGLSCLLVFGVIYFFNFSKNKKKFLELEEKGVYSIGKVYKFNNQKRYQNYYYYFYDNGEKKYNFEDINFPRLGESSVNKFYRVKFLKKNPDVVKIYLDEEVIDTNEILLYGFKLKSIKKNVFVNTSNRYINVEEKIIY